MATWTAETLDGYPEGTIFGLKKDGTRIGVVVRLGSPWLGRDIDIGQSVDWKDLLADPVNGAMGKKIQVMTGDLVGAWAQVSGVEYDRIFTMATSLPDLVDVGMAVLVLKSSVSPLTSDEIVEVQISGALDG